MSKVILCSVTDNSAELDSAELSEELGIESIAAYLKKMNIETQVYYFKNDDYKNTFLNSQVRIIGFNVYVTNYLFINKLICEIKQFQPEIKIVVGGHLVTNSDDIFEIMPDIDFAIRGEGEITSHILYSRLLSKENNNDFSDIEGITYKNEKMVIKNKDRKPIENLDTLPWPVRPLADNGIFNAFRIESARGCTGTCSFCSTNRTKWRSKSIKYTIDEMEYLINKYGVDFFFFSDSSFDNPHMNIDRMNEISDEIIKRSLCPKISTFFKADVYKAVNDMFWGKFIQAGLCTAFVGVESFHQDDLNIFSKRASAEDNIKCVENIGKQNLQLRIGFIYFHPYATYESLKVNNQVLFDLDLTSHLHQMSFLQIYRGTDLYRRTIKDGLYIDKIYNINEYHYRYPFIERLAENFKENFIMNKTVRPILSTIWDYFAKFERLVYIVQRQASFINKDSIVQMTNMELESLNLISKSLSEMFYLFFDQYIDLFYYNSSSRTIDQHVNKFISQLMKNNIVQTLNSRQMQFVAKVMRTKDININKYF